MGGRRHSAMLEMLEGERGNRLLYVRTFGSRHTRFSFSTAASLPSSPSSPSPVRVTHRQGLAPRAQASPGNQQPRQEALPQVEGESADSCNTLLPTIKTTKHHLLSPVPPFPTPLRPDREEPIEGESDSQHHLQGQESLLRQEVRSPVSRQFRNVNASLGAVASPGRSMGITFASG